VYPPMQKGPSSTKRKHKKRLQSLVDS